MYFTNESSSNVSYVTLSSNVSYVNVTSTVLINYDHRKQFDWIFPIFCNVIFLATGIWILVSLVHYGITTKQWQLRSSRRDSDKLNAGKIYSSVIVCAVLCDIYFIVNLLYTNLGFELNNNKLCEYLGDTSSALYAVCLLSVQTFLWLRQRAFYTNRMLNVNYSKPVKVISFLSIIVIFLFGVAVIIFFIYPDDHKSSPDGCTYDSDMPLEYTVIILLVILICQITLLSLFVYALRQSKHDNHPTFSFVIKDYCCCKPQAIEELPENANKRTNSVDAISSNFTTTTSSSTISPAFPVTPTSQHRTSNSKAVRIIIRKTLVFAFISILADVFIQIVIQFITGPDSHRRYPVLIGNVNTFLNLLFVIFSFAPYREMLTSPCRTYE